MSPALSEPVPDFRLVLPCLAPHCPFAAMASLSDEDEDGESIRRAWLKSLLSYLGMHDDGSARSQEVLRAVDLAAHRQQESAFAEFRPTLVSHHPGAADIIAN
eukprot:7159336-Alexandrium_andersonii.AAC.2